MARGLFGSFTRPRSEPQNVVFDEPFWRDLIYTPSNSGAHVNVDSSLRVSTVIACGRALAEGVAQLPPKVLRGSDDGERKPERDHWLHRLLVREPNSWMTSFEFRETLTLHAVLAGNGYAVKVRVGDKVQELLPVMPQRVCVEQEANFGLIYSIADKDGVFARVPAKDIFHLRGPSMNGYLGLDMVSRAREAIGLALATEENHARLFSNGTRPSGILSVENPLDKEAIERLRASWQAGNSGLANASKTIVLDNGAKWTPMTMSGVDAQAIEARKFQVEEICRIFKVFPLMVGYSDKTATFASAEQFFLAHVVHSLKPWVDRWEQTIHRSLVPASERDLFVKLSMQGLLRGDVQTRAEFYRTLSDIGAINPNEIRALEDMNPYEGGEQYRVPLNTVGVNTEPQPEQREASAIRARRNVGRVLSSENEGKIRGARDNLDSVLAKLDEQQES